MGTTWYPQPSSDPGIIYCWGGPAWVYAAYPYSYAPGGAMPFYYYAAAGPSPYYQKNGFHESSDNASRTALQADDCSDVVRVRDTSNELASTSDHEALSWGSLTVGILTNLVAKLGDSEVKSFRLVCRHWRGVVDHELESLSPTSMLSVMLVRRFPNLKVLHLTNCNNVRNRDLLTISRSGLRLHTLTLGDDMFKPWVTNSGLEHIAQITSLTSLNLHECSNVTNNGLVALSSLRGLASLSLKGCDKVTNAGIETLQRHSMLTSLNLYGCMRITDKGLHALTQLRLVSLHLGNTRVKDEGLAYLAKITTLQELHFDTEELTDAGVAQLTSLTRLESLALRDCGEVSGDSLSVLVPALPNLMSLDLYKNFTMDDSQVYFA